MRAIIVARLDKARPALILTRDIAIDHLTKVTVAPITSSIRGLTTEVAVGPRNGLDHACVVSCDNITTIPKSIILHQVGWFYDDQEDELASAVSAAFDLR